MSLILNEEQELLKETVREFAQENSPVAKLRELRDSNDETGFSRELWKEMADLGWAGIPFPEEVGGAELGSAELSVVFEELGCTLAASPLLSTVALAGNAVLLGGSDAQRKDLLPGVCSGETLLALAYQETPRHSPYSVSTRAEATADGFRLDGRKTFVLDGHVADQLVVTARTSGGDTDRDGITLFLVEQNAPGVTVQRTIMVDSRNAAQVGLDDVEVGEDAVLGEIGAAAQVLDRSFDRATLALCAEMLGCASEAFERTVAHLKTREQFGVKIGSFQALKHRAALMFCELELARSITLDGLRAVDEGREELPCLVSAAKARLSDTSALVSCEAIQMHGGIGMTDEEEIGFFLKRARSAELLVGDAVHHRERFARLQGF